MTFKFKLWLIKPTGNKKNIYLLFIFGQDNQVISSDLVVLK